MKNHRIRSLLLTFACILSMISFWFVPQNTYAFDLFYQIDKFIQQPIIRLIAGVLVSKLNNRMLNTILNVSYGVADAACQKDPSKCGINPGTQSGGSTDQSSDVGGPGAICNSSTIVACGPGLSCQNGTCTITGGEIGDSCTNNSACKSQYCGAGNTCAPPNVPGTQSGGSAGEFCDASKPCDPGLACSLDSNSCTSIKGDLSAVCSVNAECKSQFCSPYHVCAAASTAGTFGVSNGNGQGFGSNGLAQSPGYITNWRNEILQTESRGNDIFLTMLSNTQFCPYIDKEIKQSFGADIYQGSIQAGATSLLSGFINQLTPAGSTPFNLITRCTMPSNFNINTLQNDFTKAGGFPVWQQYLQNPQNNYIGASFIALDQRAIEVARTKDAEDQERLTSQGFKAKTDSGGFNNGTCKYSQKAFGRCVTKADIVTPANILSQTSVKTITSSVDRLIQARDWTDLIGALVEVAGQQLLSFGKGVQSPENIPLIQNGQAYNQYYPDQASGPDGSSEYTSLNQCLNDCGTRAATACAGETDPSKNAQCQSNAKLSCYSTCTTISTDNQTPIQPKLGDSCDSTKNKDTCGSALFCSAEAQPNICLECSPTRACSSPQDQCDAGVCVKPNGNERGGSCVADSQCAEGLFCNDNHHCRPIKTTSGSGGSTGSGGGTNTTPTPTPTSSTTSGGPITISIPSNIPQNIDGEPEIHISQPLIFTISSLPPNATGLLLFGRTDGFSKTNPIGTDATNPQPPYTTNFTAFQNEEGEWFAKLVLTNPTYTSDEFYFSVIP